MYRTKYIDPRIGTVGDEKQTSLHGGGKTHPGACFPFGMVQLSPDTTTSGDNSTGYNYCHNTIEGFSFNHLSGVGWYGDLGNLQVMPVVGPVDLRSGSNEEVPFTKGTQGWKSSFSHERECAEAGYYSVFLERYKIFCEATVSAHTGQLRFTYPQSENSGLILNFSRRIGGRASVQEVRIQGNSVQGCIVCNHTHGGFGRGKGNIDYRLYFSLVLSIPISDAFFFENETPQAKTDDIIGEDVHLFVRFATKQDEQLLIRCGISYTDLEGAINNLTTECPSFDFDGMRQRADDAWERALEKIALEGTDETELTLFYTCLYHSFLDPRILFDCDGRCRNSRDEILSSQYSRRTVFSGWDVYRSEFPLLTLLSPDVVNDEICTLLDISKEQKSTFPRWELLGRESGCMTGDPGAIVMADAYLKGIRNFDVKNAFEIACASAFSSVEFNQTPFQNTHPLCENYRKECFIPHDLSGTLEYLMSDYALEKMAKALNKNEAYQSLHMRSSRYSENYNSELGFMCPRDEKGRFLPVYNRYDTIGCLESNIFQQSFFVPYDVKGLSLLFGEERFLSLLEELFEKADFGALWNENYNHSNEPCHNLTHYFTILGKHERTQYWTRRVQKEAYRLGAYGFCGNEDVGQLSAWFVMSALGISQVCMGSEEFYLNTPLFPVAVIQLNPEYHSCSVSKTLTIECDKNPSEYPYIDEIYLNDVKLDRHFFKYAELTAGGKVKIFLKA